MSTKLLSIGNTKLKKKGIYSFGLPPIKTCPQAKECVKGCYACHGSYKMYPAVRSAQKRRYKASQSAQFCNDMSQELASLRNVRYVRIHDSGDFYSQEYLARWVAIAIKFPKVTFYFYTK